MLMAKPMVIHLTLDDSNDSPSDQYNDEDDEFDRQTQVQVGCL